ncbi:integral membrane protein 2B-like [Lineus longissimus]|uniref:integral membrane protein 2B-like n=1 Tax=Lineus longissimus TaxID=88925 RepID=UPI002B4E2982
MTIFKAKTGEKKPDTKYVAPPAVPDGVSESDANAANVYIARRRRSRMTNTCILLGVLLILGIGIAGGIYLYKHFVRGSYTAWCGVKYTDQFQREATKGGYSDAFMEEHVEIDRDGNYEKIEVPKFDICSDAVILHDFFKNLTAVIDRDRNRCFVMPLNRTEVIPPTDFWDLITKMRSGYYMPSSSLVRHHYKVMQPPVQDLTDFGPYIRAECRAYDTYRLKKMRRHTFRFGRKFHRSGRHRRSAGAECIDYQNYAGKNMALYDICFT